MNQQKSLEHDSIDEETIRLREEITEQINALNELKIENIIVPEDGQEIII